MKHKLFSREGTRGDSGFTLLQVLTSAAIIGVLATAGLTTFSETRESVEEQKLETDVRALNQAVDVYRTFGGVLDSVEYPDQVLVKLQSKSDAVSREQTAGVTGTLIDKRMKAQMQSESEAASDKPRAIWDPSLQRFVVVKGGGQRGVSRFVRIDEIGDLPGAAFADLSSVESMIGGGGVVTGNTLQIGQMQPALIEALYNAGVTDVAGGNGTITVNEALISQVAGNEELLAMLAEAGAFSGEPGATGSLVLERGEEYREPKLKLALNPGWIWDYEEVGGSAGTGPTTIPIADLGSGEGSGSSGGSGSGGSSPPPGGGQAALAPPGFSVPGGSYAPYDFDMGLTLTDPNAGGTSRILFQINGSGGWELYTGAALPLIPGTVVSAYCESIDTDYANSAIAEHDYQAYTIYLSAPQVLTSAPGFDHGANQSVIVTVTSANSTDYSRIDYRLNYGPWELYSAPFALDGYNYMYPNGAIVEARVVSTAEQYPEYYVDSNLTPGDVDPMPIPLSVPEISFSEREYVGKYYNGANSNTMVSNVETDDSGGIFLCPDGGLMARFVWQDGTSGSPGQFVYSQGGFPDAISVSATAFKNGNANEPYRADFVSTLPVDRVIVYANTSYTQTVSDYDPAGYEGAVTGYNSYGSTRKIFQIDFICTDGSSSGGSGGSSGDDDGGSGDDDGGSWDDDDDGDDYGDGDGWWTDDDGGFWGGDDDGSSTDSSGGHAWSEDDDSNWWSSDDDDGDWWSGDDDGGHFWNSDDDDGEWWSWGTDDDDGASPGSFDCPSDGVLARFVWQNGSSGSNDDDDDDDDGGGSGGHFVGTGPFKDAISLTPTAFKSNNSNEPYRVDWVSTVPVNQVAVFADSPQVESDYDYDPAGSDGTVTGYNSTGWTRKIYEIEFRCTGAPETGSDVVDPDVGEDEDGDPELDLDNPVVKGIRVRLGNPNPEGSSVIRYKVLPVQSGMSEGYQVLPAGEDTSDYVQYTDSFVVYEADYPEGFAVKAYAQSVHTGYIDSDVVFDQTKVTALITISGHTGGSVFQNKLPTNAVSNIGSGQSNSHFTWGTPASGTTTPSWMDITGANFVNVSNGERFLLGRVDYYNGTIVSGTGASKVDLVLKLNFDGAQQRTFTFSLDLINTSNNTGTQAGDADFVQLQSVVAYAPVQIYDWNFNLKIEFGETTSAGFSTINQFHVFESQGASGNVYGTLELVGGN